MGRGSAKGVEKNVLPDADILVRDTDRFCYRKTVLVFIFRFCWLSLIFRSQARKKRIGFNLYTTMKAVILTAAGGTENFSIEEIEVPQPQPTEVLVKVHALAINPVDM